MLNISSAPILPCLLDCFKNQCIQTGAVKDMPLILACKTGWWVSMNSGQVLSK